MTSLSRRKHPITVRSRWTATAIDARRLVAGLVAGWLGVTVIMAADQPVTVVPQAPANSTVTVYYEKLPNGEIRPVSSHTPQTSSSPSVFAPVPPAPQQPSYQFKPMPMEAPREVVLPAPQIQFRSVPVQSAPVSMPAPTYVPTPVYVRPALQLTADEPRPTVIHAPMQQRAIQPTAPVTMSYQRLPGGAILPVSATETMQPIPEVIQVQQPPMPMTPTTPAPAPMAPTIIQTPTPTPAVTQPVTEPPVGGPGDYGSLADYGIETKPPTLARLFRMESESELQARIIKEIENRPVKPGENKETGVKFPDYKPLTDEAFQMRQFGGLIKQIEPNYVCHGRLEFEDINVERYGWEFGVMQPFFSAGTAFKDFAFYPYKFATRPCQRFDCSAGKCYPGDPVPFLVYPPELSATGAGWETFWILAGFALIP